MARGEHNGSWWNVISPEQRLGYLLGLADAEADSRASCNVFWSVQEDLAPTKACSAFISKRRSVHESRGQQFGTFGQMLQGLNNFYSENLNQMILVNHAIIIVNHKIGGMPDDQVRKVIEAWRSMDGAR